MRTTHVRTWALAPVLLAAGAGFLLYRAEPAPQHGQEREGSEQLGHGEEEREGSRVEKAVAVMLPVGGSGVTGIVSFTKEGESIVVEGRISGLTPGDHGFHVHEYGDLRDLRAGQSAGSHFSPHEKPHGRPSDEERHAGDLGNVTANEEGVATFRMQDRVLSFEGANSILGRGLVVHEKADEFTQPVGDAGGRVALGIIGVANPDFSDD